MIKFDLKEIGENLYRIRKQSGKTQYEIAELAGLSDRTYADIERGNNNMRIGTFIQICNVLHVTPNDILLNDDPIPDHSWDIMIERIKSCSPSERATALKLLTVYLDSLSK